MFLAPWKVCLASQVATMCGSCLCDSKAVVKEQQCVLLNGACGPQCFAPGRRGGAGHRKA